MERRISKILVIFLSYFLKFLRTSCTHCILKTWECESLFLEDTEVILSCVGQEVKTELKT